MSRDRLGVLLLLFGASQLVLGLTMAFAPGFFFDNVGPYAPRNDHYIRDVATLYLALGGVAVVAWRAALLARARAGLRAGPVRACTRSTTWWT